LVFLEIASLGIVILYMVVGMNEIGMNEKDDPSHHNNEEEKEEATAESNQLEGKV
jgi:hypothetical protein